MTPDTAPSAARRARLTDHDARQRLAHERTTRLTQLQAIEETGQQAEGDLLAVQQASMRRVLKEIDDAFDRLAAGTYGICQSCAKPIPAERLEILPYTRHCVPCQRDSA